MPQILEYFGPYRESRKLKERSKVKGRTEGLILPFITRPYLHSNQGIQTSPPFTLVPILLPIFGSNWYQKTIPRTSSVITYIMSDKQTRTAAVYRNRTRSERGGRRSVAVASRQSDSVTLTHCHGVLVLKGLKIGLVFDLA